MGGELGIAPSTVAMLATATVAMECGMVAYAWYGFYAEPKYRHKARWAAAVIKITVCTILLGLLKWWLIDLPVSIRF